MRFHDSRHTFATLALQNGVDVKTVSGMLGHFVAGFTLDTYAHVTTVAQRDAAQKLDGLLGFRIDPDSGQTKMGQIWVNSQTKAKTTPELY